MQVSFKSKFEQQRTQDQWLRATNTTTTHNQKHKNSTTMVPPCPPASSGFNLLGKCDCHTLRDRLRMLQYGDTLFVDETNIFFILLTIIVQANNWLVCSQKVSFYSYYLCFFSAPALEGCALATAIWQLFFPQCLTCSCFVLA